MSWLVRLYPAAWRARYGDEMAALLEERPLGPFDLVDLLLGALDAHLHLRRPGHASEHEKGITMSLRTAGIAAIVGGTFWGLTWGIVLLDSLIGGDTGNVPVAFVTLAIAAISTLVALAGLSAAQARVHRRATWLSFLAPAAGLVILLVGFLGMPFIDGFWSLGMSGLLMYIVGVAVFAVVTWMTAVFSRAAAVLLAVASAIGGTAFLWLLMTGGDRISQWVSLVWVVVMSIAWILIGLDAIRRDRPLLAPGASGP